MISETFTTSVTGKSRDEALGKARRRAAAYFGDQDHLLTHAVAEYVENVRRTVGGEVLSRAMHYEVSATFKAVL